jgi:copper(I)-binding protein
MSSNRIASFRVVALAGLLGAALVAQAQDAAVKVEGAWARASVPGQKASGAFMKLTARDNLRLVSASSPVAGVTEVHEMKMEGDVMKMRAIPGLDLPAGKTVELKPGGYHVMLLDLKAPLAKDSSVPLTLVFKDAKGAESRVQLQVPVGLAAPGAPMGGMPMGEHKH